MVACLFVKTSDIEILHLLYKEHVIKCYICSYKSAHSGYNHKYMFKDPGQYCQQVQYVY